MQLVADIGKRYLWVDNPCIFQDDSADEAEQIYQMHAFYNSAAIAKYPTVLSGDLGRV